MSLINNNKTNNNNNNNNNQIISINSPILSEVYKNKSNHIIENTGNIHNCYTCLRPTSDDLPKIIHQKEFNKNITYNYAHYGFGWTIGWGSIFQSLEKTNINNLIKNNEKIAIIGTGLIGLSTALFLVHKGINPTNIKIYSSQFENIASTGSGAYHSLAAKLEYSKEKYDYLNDLSVKTWKFWSLIKNKKLNLENNNNNNNNVNWDELSDLIEYIPVYNGYNEKESDIKNSKGLIESPHGMDGIIKEGLIPNEEIVTININNKNKFHKVKKTYSYYYNADLIISTMTKLLLQYNVHIIEQTVYKDDIKNFTQENIFICAGLGTKKINNDENLHAYCGHMIHLTDQPVINFEKKNKFILYSGYKKTKDSPIENILYMPKVGLGYNGIIGSSKIKDYYGDNNELNHKYFNDIIEKVRDVFGYYDNDINNNNNNNNNTNTNNNIMKVKF